MRVWNKRIDHTHECLRSRSSTSTVTGFIGRCEGSVSIATALPLLSARAWCATHPPTPPRRLAHCVAPVACRAWKAIGNARTTASRSPRLNAVTVAEPCGRPPGPTWRVRLTKPPDSMRSLLLSHPTHLRCPRSRARACHAVSRANHDKRRLSVAGKSVYRTGIHG